MKKREQKFKKGDQVRILNPRQVPYFSLSPEKYEAQYRLLEGNFTIEIMEKRDGLFDGWMYWPGMYWPGNNYNNYSGYSADMLALGSDVWYPWRCDCTKGPWDLHCLECIAEMYP